MQLARHGVVAMLRMRCCSGLNFEVDIDEGRGTEEEGMGGGLEPYLVCQLLPQGADHILSHETKVTVEDRCFLVGNELEAIRVGGRQVGRLGAV